MSQADDRTTHLLIDDLVGLLRDDQIFELDDPVFERRVNKLRETFEQLGVSLSSSGRLDWISDSRGSPQTSREENFSPRKVATAMVAPSSQPPGRRVFVVHGRDHRMRDELVALLRALDLLIVDWAEASNATGVSAPTTAQVIDAGDGTHESSPTGQARLNVVFEAGMAWAKYRDRTVLVEVGRIRPMSDLAGVQMLRLNNGRDSRRMLRDRLRNTGLAVADGDFSWTTTGSFE